MKFTQKTMIDAAAMTGPITSDAILLDQIYGYSISESWTGTPTGNIIVQKSNDKVVWFTEDTQAAGGAASSKMVEKTAFYKWVRVIYDFTGSTGTLTVEFFAKGN